MKLELTQTTLSLSTSSHSGDQNVMKLFFLFVFSSLISDRSFLLLLTLSSTA